jgi:hypothetical protein
VKRPVPKGHALRAHLFLNTTKKRMSASVIHAGQNPLYQKNLLETFLRTTITTINQSPIPKINQVLLA